MALYGLLAQDLGGRRAFRATVTHAAGDALVYALSSGLRERGGSAPDLPGLRTAYELDDGRAGP